MQVVIPMTGLGSRFSRAGYTAIKPLIPIDGKPMIEYVVQLFPGETNFLFICNNDHLKQTALRAELERIMPTGKIVGVDYSKKGPVWAVLSAQEYIQNHEPIIVNYCDFFALWDYLAFKQMIETTACAGAIPCYIGFHPHLLGSNLYASCKTDTAKNLL
ncbi:MAG: hypothetical protein ACD_21C00031G0006, partial [uncultured bacterium]